MANTLLLAIKIFMTFFVLALGMSCISALAHASAKKTVSKLTLTIITFIFIVLMTLSVYYLTKLFSFNI